LDKSISRTGWQRRTRRYVIRALKPRPAILAAALLGIHGIALGQGGPPMITDDPETPPPGHWEDNVGLVTTAARDGSWEADAPQVDLNLGWTDRLYVKYETAWVVVRDPRTGRRSGVGDSLVGFKWRFVEEPGEGWAISAYPKLQFNTGASAYRRGVVERNSGVQLPFEFQKALSESIKLDFEIGYTGHTRHAAEADFWNEGLLLVKEVDKRLTVMAELYGLSDRRFRGNGLLANAGFNWSATSTFALIASAGPGLAGADRPKWIAYLGSQVTY
jgi:hypothetical protein